MSQLIIVIVCIITLVLVFVSCVLACICLGKKKSLVVIGIPLKDKTSSEEPTTVAENIYSKVSLKISMYVKRTTMLEMLCQHVQRETLKN